MPGGLLDLFGIDPIANRQAKERLMLQELANRGQLESMRMQGTNALATERERGEQSRKTNASKAESDKVLESLRSSNAISEAAKKQIMDILAKEGVMYNEQNAQVFDKATADTRIRNALARDMNAGRVQESPAYQQSLEKGAIAANLAPAFQNMRTGAMGVGSNEMMIAPPSGVSLPPTDLNKWNQAQGAMQNERMVTIPSMFEGLPPSTSQIRETTPGRVRIAPDIQQRAMSIVPAPEGQTMTNNQISPYDLFGIQQLLR